MSAVSQAVLDAHHEASVLADVLKCMGNALLGDPQAVCGTGIVLVAELLGQRLDILEQERAERWLSCRQR